jgi:hypothetical protein
MLAGQNLMVRPCPELKLGGGPKERFQNPPKALDIGAIVMSVREKEPYGLLHEPSCNEINEMSMKF